MFTLFLKYSIVYLQEIQIPVKHFFTSYIPYYRSNLKLAGPVMISQLGHTLVSTADSVIVGHFAGTIPLAAVSLVNSVFMVVLVLGLGVAYGITPLVAQENGKKNYEECARLLSNSIFLNIIVGLGLFVVVYFGSMWSLDHLDQEPAVVKEARPYLLLLSLTIIPLMIFSAFKQFAEGLGFTRQAMNISIWGNVLNIILAIIFVKGMFGIEPMGVKGVGYSTLIDRCLMAMVMGWYVFKSKTFQGYIKSFKWFPLDRTRSWKIFQIGWPVGMQYVFEIGAFAAAAILAGTLGATQQAAHQVAINLAAITYMMASGIAAAATIQTGHSLGSANFTRLKRSAVASYHIVLIFMGLMAILFASANQLLPWIYTADTDVIFLAAQLLIIAGMFQLFDGTQVVGLGILRGLSDVRVPTLITFVAYWVIGLPVAYLLGIHFQIGLKGIWYGLTLGLLSSSLLLFTRFRMRMRTL